VIPGVGAGVTLALAAGLLSACATVDGSAPGSGSATASSAAPPQLAMRRSDASSSVSAGGCQARAAFTTSIALGFSGAPTPLKAVEDFVLHGSVPGYGDAASRWQITGHDAQGVTLTAGPVRLHALQLTHRTWVVDSGERCAS
jgi:ABC-type phosphate transport system substrate-binding protein